MTRAVGPRVGLPPDAAMPMLLIIVMWIPAALAGMVWTAGHAASSVSGHGWTGPAFTFKWSVGLLSRGPGPSWPLVPTGLIWAIAGGAFILLAAPAIIWYLRWNARRAMPGDPMGSLGTERELAVLCPPGMAARALKLRPSLARYSVKHLLQRPDETGLPLGLLKGTRTRLRASWEDVLLIFMSPRSGKTSEIAVPQVLAAPGAVVATSNKSDLWALTAGPRKRQTRQPVWVFDPQSITYAEQTFWWNPLRGVNTVEAATRLAGHFVAQVKGETRFDFWTQAAEDVLTSLLLAAGTTVGAERELTLDDVYDWLNDPNNPQPVTLLAKQGHRAASRGLAGKQNGAEETRDGIYETARTAAKCLRDPGIMAWVTPPRAFPLSEFHSAEFAGTKETLYLLSKEDAGGAAPLVAAFADKVMFDATRLAERRGGRIDPPMVVVLDEAANICRIENLPKLYSHLGGRGVIPVTILQSYPQGVGVWGQNGMETLFSASTVKIFGAGLDDDRSLEALSRLIGDHDVTTRSVNQGKGHYGENLALRRQRIMPVEKLRGMAKGTSILIASGVPPAMLSMEPWYLGPRKQEIAQAAKDALRELTERAERMGATPAEVAPELAL